MQRAHDPRQHMAEKLRNQLTHRFHTVVGHGDYANSKPAPDPYLVAAERLAAMPACCLALEDSHSGVRSAAAAGMMTIMVPDLVPPTEEINDLCHCVVPSLREVAVLLRESISDAE